jgi:hypothetical protein
MSYSSVKIQNIYMFVGKLDIFFLISLSDITSINLVTLILNNIGQLMTFNTDKDNNVRLEGPNTHYHSSSFQTRCEAINNVCLDIQNCCYSVFIF